MLGLRCPDQNARDWITKKLALKEPDFNSKNDFINAQEYHLNMYKFFMRNEIFNPLKKTKCV